MIPVADAQPLHRCTKTYTVSMVNRAIDATFHGPRDVSAVDVRHLRHFIACARNPRDQRGERARWVRARRAWWRRVSAPMSVAVASWYSDAGATASGWHAYYGVASLAYALGTRVRICYPVGSSRCVSATVDDRGPYITARSWDLNQNVAAALGFSGVDSVSWRVAS